MSALRHKHCAMRKKQRRNEENVADTIKSRRTDESENKSDREIALELLQEILEKKKFSHLVLKDTLDRHPEKTPQQKAFITRLTEGTLERVITLDYILDSFSKIKVNKMKPFIRNLLRLGVYQICYMEVPDAAACSEAVKLAEKRGFSGLKGFVNGVLRNIARQKEQLVFPEGEEGLSVRYSVPLWIIRHLKRSYGEKQAEDILKNLTPEDKGLCVRFNESRYSQDVILETLKKDGITVMPHPFGAGAWLLEGYETVTALRAFQMGMFQVQDYASMMPGEAVKEDVRPGMTVMDVCAAPGGKSLHLADILRGTGRVISRDISKRKIEKIRENRRRCGFTNMEEEVWDAAQLKEDSIGLADIVLADLPCSGLGILAKKPDIRYNCSETSLKELARLQREILSVVWQYVKPGGILVYSTCTMNPEENERNTEWFLAGFPFKKESEKQYYPAAGLSDGFYVAKLRRI